MRSTVRKIFGDGMASALKPVWGFDEEGELRGMWRRSGQDGFWFMGGNFALARYYSRLLALQIKALEEGLMSYDDL
ncbi:hypothetical protein B9Z19DRAFT_1079810 [Tuber borchii]|uniref:Uncharacterized protein n=1 Tax=Tuber borchii TaxID=42251 RepID=A0A2T6ZXN2_TUBBO|nr:hypothetical protein B9Z19DRAFT_1079810 [Tuber borchii]